MRVRVRIRHGCMCNNETACWNTISAEKYPKPYQSACRDVLVFIVNGPIRHSPRTILTHACLKLMADRIGCQTYSFQFRQDQFGGVAVQSTDCFL